MSAERSSIGLEIKGLALITVIGLLIWLSIAIYDKAFSDEVVVTVRTQSAGLQLNKNADVRMRGALVGRVSAIEERNGAALVVLDLDPTAAKSIPANVEARILPTTLFGQKYVQLVAPSGVIDTGGPHIQAGAVIGEDRSAAAIEVTTALDHLGPVLNAIEPQDLSMTLQAIAEGLDGRGDELGATVTRARGLLDAYIQNLPALVRDLRLAAGVTNAYATAAPDVLTLLSNLTTTSSTLAATSPQLKALLANFTNLSKVARGFLDQNGTGIIEVNNSTAPVLDLLARYAPEIPCLLQGLVISNQSFNSAFSHGKLHSFLTLGLQYPGYSAADRPSFGAAPGPTCAGLPRVGGPVLMPIFNDGGSHPAGQLVVP
jgi:phospholipid/cholesterol/gamma-HCH transport system substrate-binding protein